MSRRAAFETTAMAAGVVPTTAMVATNHTWMAAGTIGAVLASLLVQARIRTRAATEQHRETLTYAHTATSLGADPSPVIRAMRSEDEDRRAARTGPADGDDLPPIHYPPRRH
jgi:hypothetical protein